MLHQHPETSMKVVSLRRDKIGKKVDKFADCGFIFIWPWQRLKIKIKPLWATKHKEKVFGQSSYMYGIII